MKKTILFACTIIIGLNLFSGKRALTNAAGPPAGNTGAAVLGETTCLQGGCHRGNLTEDAPGLTMHFVNNATEYKPDSTYSIILTNTNGTGSTNGFQMLCLNDANASKGTFTAVNNVTKKLTLSGRTYFEHARSSTTGSWTFTWKAPAAGTGDLHFFVASHRGSSENSSNVATKEFVFTERPAPVTGIAKLTVSDFSIFPNPARDNARASFTMPAAGKVRTSLHSVAGQELMLINEGSFDAGTHEINVPLQGLTAGTYILHIDAGDRTIARKLSVQ
ncbi:MAG: choice-of-anchor V domain-containing protein [Bacteroidota bacterium]